MIATMYYDYSIENRYIDGTDIDMLRCTYSSSYTLVNARKGGQFRVWEDGPFRVVILK